MSQSLILVARLRSGWREYTLFEATVPRIKLVFMWQDGRVVGYSDNRQLSFDAAHLSEVPYHLLAILKQHQVMADNETIAAVGVKVVAPGAYFLEDRIIDDEYMTMLEKGRHAAPAIGAVIEETRVMKEQFPQVPIVGVSDSAFHITKPDYAWNYGINLADADAYDIKRFGYHGVMLASAVEHLKSADRAYGKTIICHIDDESSVTALEGGKSIDTTTGYSTLEGPVMAAKSGLIDFAAARMLRRARGMSEEDLEVYLTTQAGLRGLSGSGDAQEVLRRQADGDHVADLAIQTYVMSLQKAIGAMVAALGGLDQLVFVGAVAEDSPALRQKIVDRLDYLGCFIDSNTNQVPISADITPVGYPSYSKPILVVRADETASLLVRVRHQLQ